MMAKKTNPFPGKICVSVAAENTEAALEAAKKEESKADVIEIRLDSLTNPDITPFLKGIHTPLLFTNRPVWEGGFYDGPENIRIALLMQAVEAGAAYVDIEIKSSKEEIKLLCDKAHSSGTKIIASWHNFKETPPHDELLQILSKQQNAGVHIGKMVTFAHSFKDVLRVLQLQETAHEKGFPLCAFCMGRAGMISRLATLELGGFMTYAAPDRGEATAPGQMKVSDILSALRSFPHEN